MLRENFAPLSLWPVQELTSLLGPLAAVNFNHCASATSALERGDTSRTALQAYRKSDPEGQGYLERDGMHAFLAAVFQNHSLTPPLETHVGVLYRRFDPEDDRLEALACLCLADAMIRMVLRAGLSTLQQPQAAPAAPRYPVVEPVLKCRACGEIFEEDAKFCMACGAKRPVTASPHATLSSPALSPPLASACPASISYARKLSVEPIAACGATTVGAKVLDASRVKSSVFSGPAVQSPPMMPHALIGTLASNGGGRLAGTFP